MNFIKILLFGALLLVSSFTTHAAAAVNSTNTVPNLRVLTNATITSMASAGNVVVTNTLQVGATRTNVYGNRAVIGAGSTPKNTFYAATTDLTEGTTGSALAIGPSAATGNTTLEIRGLDQGGNSGANIGMQVGSDNVGIGTLTPGSKLTVAGDVTITNSATGTTPLTIAGQTVSGADSNSIVNLSTIWNTTGNPSALKLVITDTASGSSAKALEILGGAAGTTALFNLTKSGNALFADGTAANPSIGWVSDFDGSGTGFFRTGANQIGISINGVQKWNVDGNGHLQGPGNYIQASGIAVGYLSAICLANNKLIQWSSDTSAFGTPDTILLRDAANTLALRNGVNAQALRWYQSYTDTSNYQRGILTNTATSVMIAAETLGTGADNIDITLTPAGTGTVKAPVYQITGTTNQVIFGGTNTAPSSAVAPTKWISVQVAGEATVYRLPLYE